MYNDNADEFDDPHDLPHQRRASEAVVRFYIENEDCDKRYSYLLWDTADEYACKHLPELGD